PWPPGATTTAQVYSGYACRPEIELPDDQNDFSTLDIHMPKLNQFKNKAIFADLTAMATRVDTRHITGLNVLYGDGSASWFRRDPVDQDLRACTSISPAFNPQQDRIWQQFDKK